MSTSANVIEYRIEKNGKEVGNFRKNLMCRLPEIYDLLKYQPLCDYDITPHGYDEEDEEWEDETVNLEVYLRKYIRIDKTIREYFKTLDNG